MGQSYYSITNNVVTVPAGEAAEFLVSAFVTPDKQLKLMPESGATLHVLFTKGTDTTEADADDFPVPSGGMDIAVGRRIGRISVFNSGEEAKKLFIATLQ